MMTIARTDTRLESRSTELMGTAVRLCMLAVAISANFTDYGPLIPLLQHELHVTSGATGLLSTLLYVGIGLSYLPGGLARGSLRVAPRSLCDSAPGWGRWMPPASVLGSDLDRVLPVGDRVGRRGSNRLWLAGGTSWKVRGLRPGPFWRSDAGRRRTRAVRDSHLARCLRLARGL